METDPNENPGEDETKESKGQSAPQGPDSPRPQSIRAGDESVATEIATEIPPRKRSEAEQLAGEFKVVEKWQIILTAALVFIGLATTGVYLAQLKQMRKSTKASTVAAKAARDSVVKAEASAHLDQRAWLGVIAIDGLPVKGQKFRVDVTLKNTGKTFARKVTVRAGIIRIPNWQIPDFEEMLNTVESKSRGLIPPDGTMHSINETSDEIDEKELGDIELGSIDVFVFGKTTYQDIFFCDHWTTFCYVLHGGTASGWKHDAYQSYNEADINCGPTEKRPP